MVKRKLSDQEIQQRNLLLADHACQQQECLQRKHDFNQAINKELRHHAEIIVEVAREINDRAVTEDEPRLPMEEPVTVTISGPGVEPITMTDEGFGRAAKMKSYWEKKRSAQKG